MSGDLDTIATGRPALIHGLGVAPGPSAIAVRPVAAPPSGNPDVATVDLFFQLPNQSRNYRPGQKLGVTLELTGTAEALQIPWSAIVQDIYGGSWVYVRTEPQTFVRAVSWLSASKTTLPFLTGVRSRGPKS